MAFNNQQEYSIISSLRQEEISSGGAKNASRSKSSCYIKTSLKDAYYTHTLDEVFNLPSQG